MTNHWENRYKLDISVLDAQHKQLISCLNELSTAMREGLTSRNLEEILVRLEQYTVRHFGLEEKYMVESNYPGLEKQQRAHTDFISRLGRIMAEYKEGGLTSSIVTSLRNELTEWIRNHITGLDQEFGEYFKRFQKEMLAAPEKAEI